MQSCRHGIMLFLLAGCAGTDAVTVGSKNFTESVILGEIVAQVLERAGVDVKRRFNLGGTFIGHEAIRNGQIDAYVEYTGTAYSAILELPVERDPAKVWSRVDSVYRERWDLVWMPPLGFNNTFAMLVRGADARRLGITTLSEAAAYSGRWRPGFGYEFMERADGLDGLVDAYGLEFGERPAVMELGLTYRALASGAVDIIAGNSTDGQIAALDLFHLADDKRYFPPYEAAAVVRTDVLARDPEVGRALRRLTGTIDDVTMRRLNYLVDVERRDVRVVAQEFLDSIGG
jgi:glycine betaine/choline ABC-type transport system substrate-binding protein